MDLFWLIIGYFVDFSNVIISSFFEAWVIKVDSFGGLWSSGYDIFLILWFLLLHPWIFLFW